MIPSAFDYARATSVEDAVAKLAAAGGPAKRRAGVTALLGAERETTSSGTNVTNLTAMQTYQHKHGNRSFEAIKKRMDERRNKRK